MGNEEQPLELIIVDKTLAKDKPAVSDETAISKVRVPVIDRLVARFSSSVYSQLKQAGAIRDGEQHWYGGTVDYSPGGHDVSTEPDSDYELPEDSRYQLVEHQNNQQY
ncbi:MAG: hypothetical protein V1839_01960 [archaeon]